MNPKKFMRKVLVAVDVDVQHYHMWVEDLGDDKKTLALAQKTMSKDKDMLIEDASISVHASLSECADDSMDDQAITEDDGWVNVADLTDDQGNKVTPTSDRRYCDPNYEQTAWYREELEKAGQQQLPLGDKNDG